MGACLMRLKKLIKNYYYGDPHKRDFTDADLPENRIELFKEVLKVRKESMLLLNLLYLVIWLPAIIWTGIHLIPLLYTQIQNVNSYFFTYFLFLFPAVAITGPCTAGISFVMRNWARDEHSFLFSDYILGIRENWKQGLMMSCINGLVPLLVFIGIQFYTNMAKASAMFYVPMVLLILMALLWNIACQLMPMMMVTYKLSFPAVVKNSVLLSLATLPKALAIRLTTLALPLVLMIIAVFFPRALVPAGAIVIIAYLFFMLSLNRLIIASYANYACETYFNPRIEGAQSNIGLHIKKEKH